MYILAPRRVRSDSRDGESHLPPRKRLGFLRLRGASAGRFRTAPRTGTRAAVATLLVLALLGANDCSNPNARLLFKSGFESDTWIEAVTGAAYNQWPRIHGADNSTG